MNYRGSVDYNRFAEFFGLVSKYNAFWVSCNWKSDSLAEFVEYSVVILDNPSTFEAEFACLFSEKAKPTGFWNKIKSFFN